MKIINLLISILFFTSNVFAEFKVSQDFKLFCTSGGFMYNYLEVNEEQEKLKFHSYGTPWGIQVEREILGIKFDTDISSVKFNINKKLCEVRNHKEKVPLKCFIQKLKFKFMNEVQDQFVEKDLHSVEILVENKALIIKQEGKPVVYQFLNTCTALTGL